MFARLSPEIRPDVRQYLSITGNYWAFTLTDGALRMLVVLHFHRLGYSPLQVAMLFVFYEIFGVVTNLLGGWLGARIGLNRTMNIGLALQVVALSMLLVPAAALTVPWVMAAQALSGIAKDLNKMSAKSSIKLLVPGDRQGVLYRWVAALTGSKNALKGVGFFLGGALLTSIGFAPSVAAMAGALALVWALSLWTLRRDLGKASSKPKFRDIFSKSRAINLLSAARMFLFGARDIWFVVALPVFLAQTLGWDFWRIGGFMAAWVIGYGMLQSVAPYLTGKRSGRVPDGRSALVWACMLSTVPAATAALLWHGHSPQTVLVAGLTLFGALFAINSSLHSYLIVSYAAEDAVSLDVGFYYMANAMGRLSGTVLSGWVFQRYGIAMCLAVSAAMVAAAAAISAYLPKHARQTAALLRAPADRGQSGDGRLLSALALSAVRSSLPGAATSSQSTTMSQHDPAGEHADALDFLRERLERGNECLMEGNARGAIVNYDSALVSFHIASHIPALRETYRTLWTNKALAHQQLREFVKSQEAAMFANNLAPD